MNIRPILTSLVLPAALLLTLLCGNNHNAYAQGIAPQDLEKLQIMEDSMVVTIDSMYEAYLPDTHVGYSERFIRQLVKTLKYPNSYLYPFDKLKDKISIIYADDNGFRIFNWGVDMSMIYRRYYGAIQLPSEKLKLFGLSDYSQEMARGAEDSILTNRKWYGALYYRILHTEVDGQKIYTMFGFNGGSPLSNKKVLDALTITDNDITFGAPIFGITSTNFPGKPVNRFILEYKKDVQVSMNWDSTRNVIIFDNLVSQVNDPNRKYTYVPSGQYDGFRWNENMWMYLPNLIPIKELQDGEAPTDEKPTKK